MLRLIPLFIIVFFGISGTITFGYYSLIDWDVLQKDYLNFFNIAQNSPELTALFFAEAQQNIHRINLFAEGVWTLLSAILAAIGLHGIFASSKRTRS